jgi:NAD-dependent deacetylase
MKADAAVVILTGAGLSAESGLCTFREDGGLWENHRVEEVATPDAFRHDPELVHRFYNQRRQQLQSLGVVPNAAHLAITEFQKKWPGIVTIVTQNVDNLHERAGNQNILHMHGELLKVRCIDSGMVFPWKESLESEAKCLCCHKPWRMRPHIVWFGEMPLFMDDIDALLCACDLFVSIGTSGSVYPAAGFVDAVSRNGREAKTVDLNLEPTVNSDSFGEAIYGKATEVVPRYFSHLIK